MVFSIVSPEVKNHKAGKNIYPRLKAHNSPTHTEPYLALGRLDLNFAATGDDKKTFTLLVGPFNNDEIQLP